MILKIEFGKTPDGQILLADEISPDSCRLWDVETNQKYDKDVFRQDIGDLIETYKAVLDKNDKIKTEDYHGLQDRWSRY